jgi:hypothetical protein
MKLLLVCLSSELFLGKRAHDLSTVQTRRIRRMGLCLGKIQLGRKGKGVSVSGGGRE